MHLSVHLFVRHRQAEITDAKWLQEWERHLLGEPVVHGEPWQRQRKATSANAGWFSVLARKKSNIVWPAVLSLFSVAAFAAFVLAVGWPGLLQSNSW